MIKSIGIGKNYSYCDYKFDKTTVRYVVMNDGGNTFMLLIPAGMEHLVNDTYETVQTMDGGYPDNYDWMPGSLVHVHLTHHMTPMADSGFKFSQSSMQLKFHSQSVTENDDCICIETVAKADEGYLVKHMLTNYKGENGFEVRSIFENNTGAGHVAELLDISNSYCHSCVVMMLLVDD